MEEKILDPFDREFKSKKNEDDEGYLKILGHTDDGDVIISDDPMDYTDYYNRTLDDTLGKKRENRDDDVNQVSYLKVLGHTEDGDVIISEDPADYLDVWLKRVRKKELKGFSQFCKEYLERANEVYNKETYTYQEVEQLLFVVLTKIHEDAFTVRAKTADDIKNFVGYLKRYFEENRLGMQQIAAYFCAGIENNGRPEYIMENDGVVYVIFEKDNTVDTYSSDNIVYLNKNNSHAVCSDDYKHLYVTTEHIQDVIFPGNLVRDMLKEFAKYESTPERMNTCADQIFDWTWDPGPEEDGDE